MKIRECIKKKDKKVSVVRQAEVKLKLSITSAMARQSAHVSPNLSRYLPFTDMGIGVACGECRSELWLHGDGYVGEDTGMPYPATKAALVLDNLIYFPLSHLAWHSSLPRIK